MSQNSDYLSVSEVTEHEITIERSRFIGYAARVENEADAKEFVAKIRKANSLATHNCYAYVASADGNIMKFSDDGEPQGTAGQPILEVLKARGLRMTAVVVTRYFGGIKLGAGGLVRAYSGVAAATLDRAKLAQNIYSAELETSLGYEQYAKFTSLISGRTCAVSLCEFGQNVRLRLVLPLVSVEGFLRAADDCYLGKVTFERVGERYGVY